MGRFIYDQSVKVEFDDRLLAHLLVVIGSKLRRGEAFHFSWREELDAGGGRTTVWMHPGVSLVYRFSGSRIPRINVAWVEALALTANSPSGLRIIPEPPEISGDSEDAAS